MDINAPIFADFGLWLGFALSLALFSLLIRDNFLARLAQHVLTGALMGYLALVAWHDVLRPRLLGPLLRGEDDALWIPAALGAILFVAGLQRILEQPNPQTADGADAVAQALRRPAWWARLLFGLGRIPVAIMVGVGLGVGIVGAWEGTFLPQYLRAAQIALELNAPAGRILIGLLTLLLTTGVMLHLYVGVDRFARLRPAYVRRALVAWVGIGRYALWLAAGILFARLLAARMSLLIAQVQWLADVLAENALARWLQTLLG